LVSFFVAEDMMLSFESSLFYFRIGVFSCLIWYLIEQDKKILDYFYYVLIFCFLVLVLDGYYQYFTGYNSIGLKVIPMRVSSFFGDELIMGSYLSRLYPLAFALSLLRSHNRLEKGFITILFILTSGLIYISGERTSVFFNLLSLTFIFILVKKLKFIRFLILISFIGIIFIFTFNDSGLKNRMLNSPIETMGINKEVQYIFTPGHDSLIRTAYQMFLDRPIFGHGPKMFRVICKDEKYATGVSPCMTHPHNFYVQLLAETGIVGFLFLFSALMYVIYCSLRQFKTIIFKEQRYLNDYQVCLVACLLITVWPLSPNGNFFNNWLVICYSLPVGFYLHSIYGRNKEEILEE
ncbi:O-antigen ligase family protein, partial [bacterium]|nr:O-antigen ligase family protein [bacterium]